MSLAGKKTHFGVKDFYSPTGRPSIDPEVLLRLLLVGYIYGIVSERRLMDEVRMHPAYRWFTRLGLTRRFPTTGRSPRIAAVDFGSLEYFARYLRRSRRCLAAGFVEGRNVAADALVGPKSSDFS